MKKIILIIAAILSVATVKAQCKNENKNCCEKQKSDCCAQKQNECKQPKTLIAFFSATGTTKNAANQLAEIINADLFEIVPVQPYTADDLNWRNQQSRSFVEIHDQSIRPEIKNKVENFDEYDFILVGYPIWWDLAPNIIYTFLDSYDFSNKTVVPFATSGGSTIDNSEKDLRKNYSTYPWGPGTLINTINPEALKKWEDKYHSRPSESLKSDPEGQTNRQ